MIAVSCTSTEGRINLADGTILKLMVNIIDVRENGFSPFGGVNLSIKQSGGTAAVKVPDELVQSVKDKPLYSSANQPQDGWEMIEIAESTPAKAETKIQTTKGYFLVEIKSLATMVSRNMTFKNEFNEPVYLVNFVIPFSWKLVS